MLKHIFLASITTVALVGAAHASTFGGDFDVSVVNVTNLNASESQATLANFNSYFTGCAATSCDTFGYDGLLDFSTSVGPSTTISDWLSTGPGTLSGLDATVGGLQQSKGSINNGTATSTFYMFTASFAQAMDFDITHDDGIAVFDDGVLLGGNVGPTSETNTSVFGFDGGELSILYVATNSDPSILHVEASPIPLPAGLPLLAAGLGSIFALRRRAKA